MFGLDKLGGGALSSIGGGISGLSSALGGIAGRGAVKAGNRAYMEALEKIKKAYEDQTVLNPEDYVVDYSTINPEDLQYYTPEQEAAVQQGETALSQISTDPYLRQQQMEALSRLSNRAEQGLTLSDLAARNQLVSAGDQANRGQQEAVLQNMARRGQLGGGAELAARMAAQQGSYQNTANQLEQLAAERDQNALKAALESGNLAGNMREQEHGEQSDLAKARDAIAQFNANQRSGVQQRNVNSRNDASENTAGLKNKAYLTNLDLANQQATQRTQGLQNSTSAQNQKALDVANAQLGIGTAKQAQGIQKGQYIGGVFKGFGDLLGGSLQAFGSKPQTNNQPNQMTDQSYNQLASASQMTDDEKRRRGLL